MHQYRTVIVYFENLETVVSSTALLINEDVLLCADTVLDLILQLNVFHISGCKLN